MYDLHSVPYSLAEVACVLGNVSQAINKQYVARCIAWHTAQHVSMKHWWTPAELGIVTTDGHCFGSSNPALCVYMTSSTKFLVYVTSAALSGGLL
jgi:hypothetical protein